MFVGQLEVEQLTESSGDQNATWKLLRPFGFQSALYGVSPQAPAGFVTDFASVPRIPIAFEIDGDIAQDCATVHDYMYTSQCVSRQLADLVLLEMLQLRGFSSIRCQSIYLAVRMFGASHYGTP